MRSSNPYATKCCVQATAMGVPKRPENRAYLWAVTALQLGVDWRSTRILDPLGVIDEDGCVDLQKGYAMHLEQAAARKLAKKKHR